MESSGESQWELLSVVDNTQLGSPQRMVEKLRHTAESWHQSRGERGMTGMERRQLEGERDRAKGEKRELEGERDRAREEKRELEVRAREAELRVREGELRVQEMEGEREREKLQEARERANELKQRRLEKVERREHEKSVVQEQAIAAKHGTAMRLSTASQGQN